MFNEWGMQGKFSRSIQENLGSIFDSSGMKISPEIADSIGAVLDDLFSLDFHSSAGVTLRKTPKNFGDSDNHRGVGLFNVIPSTKMTSYLTDTLLVYCMGSDNLNTRLADTLIEVGKHHFKTVIFVTTKWDMSAVTGSNTKRLQDLIELTQAGTAFCFILASISGLSWIPVL